MELKLDVKAALDEEKTLFYSHSEKDDEIACGSIGHLRGDFGNGTEFFTTFWVHCYEFRTQHFKDELDIVINNLRKPGGLLNNLQAMTKYCYKHHTVKLTTWNDRTYGYKAESDMYSYYIRCCILRGDYNFYIYCYCRDRLLDFLETSKA